MNIKDLFKKIKKDPAVKAASEVVYEKIEPASSPQIQREAINVLDQVVLSLTMAILVVFPLFFLPFLANSVGLPKQILLILFGLTGVALFFVRAATAHRLVLVRSIFDLPLILFVGLTAFSAYLTPNRLISLLGDPLLLAGAATLFFLIAQTAVTKDKFSALVKAFLLPLVLLSFLAIAQFGVPILAGYIKNPLLNLPILSPGFNPAGSTLAMTLLLLAGFPVALGLSWKTKDGLAAAFAYLLAIGAISSCLLLYKNPPIILPQSTGWRIATHTIGQSLTGTFLDSLLGIPADSYSALFGTGPGNFLDAFTMFKSVDFNTTSYWNLRFTNGANYYFYLLTTVGIAGLSAFLFLVARLFRTAQKRFKLESISSAEKGLLGSLVLTLILFLILPAPEVLIIAFFTLLALLVANFRIGENREYARLQIVDLASGLFNFVPAAIVGGVILLLGFHLVRFALADYFYAQSLVAAANNQGTNTYNLQIRAINLNPDNDLYHLSYSQTNLALANSLASQPNLSDQQKQAVIQLVQQAIREGRSAVALAPRRSGNYENLSAIYRSLINFAQGADQWTLASLNQAINFDPTNPRLRLDLGGIYFAASDFNTAAQTFSLAISLKNDYANAHYNLAQAYKNLKLPDRAASELQLTASLICPASGTNADCDKVNQEIQALTSQKESASPSATPSAAPETGQTPLATSSAQKSLPKVKTTTPVKISTPSGEIQP